MTPLRPSAVLIVDDDADHAWIVRVMLGTMCPDLPVEVCSELRTLDVATAALPGAALVLMDRMIRGTETFDRVVDLHARRPDLAIVMMSAMFTSVDRAYAIACGAHEAIEKPSGLGGWRAALEALVGTPDADPRRTTRAA